MLLETDVTTVKSPLGQFSTLCANERCAAKTDMFVWLRLKGWMCSAWGEGHGERQSVRSIIKSGCRSHSNIRFCCKSGYTTPISFNLWMITCRILPSPCCALCSVLRLPLTHLHSTPWPFVPPSLLS